MMYVCRVIAVSIHAPVKGATADRDQARGHVIVSIHAPVKGATLAAVQQSGWALVSIHVPVKGATRRWAVWDSQGLCFNPRSREGSDPPPSAGAQARAGFNPRSREGSDRGSITL